MELNREQIIQALEFCSNCECNNEKTQAECPLINMPFCKNYLRKQSLALIKELTEKTEEYCRECAELRVVLYEITDEVNQIKADVVRKTQKLFEERLDISVCGYSTEEVVSDVLETLDRVVTEVLEEYNV